MGLFYGRYTVYSFTMAKEEQEQSAISKKRKFVLDGLFKAELNELLWRELAEDGYSGVEVRVTPNRTEIIILATRTQNFLVRREEESVNLPLWFKSDSSSRMT